jgi:aspartate dehydrogenase
MRQRRIALIGFGAIGGRVASVLRQQAPDCPIVAVLLRPGSARAVPGVPVVTDIAGLRAAQPELVLECAGQAALASVGPAVLAAGIDLVVASVGALADPEMESLLRGAAEESHARLTLATGAVGGLDALSAMRLAGPIRVLYRSRKPPAAWAGSAAEKLVDLANLTSATSFARVSARRAALDYPKNANVAATIALAGAGLDATECELVADPSVSANIHEIEAHGPTGEMFVRMEGVPDPENPRTSMLTAYSMVKAAMG